LFLAFFSFNIENNCILENSIMKRKNMYLKSKTGQGMTEFIIIVGLIAVAAILVTVLFGDNIRKQFGKSGNAVGGKKTSDVPDTKAVTKEADVRDLSNFAAVPPPEPAAPPVPPTPPLPPPPPLPPNPLEVGVRHHIGDGSFGAGLGGGSLQNEGTSFSVGFNLTQEQINYANSSNNGIVYLKFGASGVNSPSNGIMINGQQVGFVHDGGNTVAINVNNLPSGNNTVTINSSTNNPGFAGGDYDDFEMDDIQVSY
jgi:Flp pilus assembly pilin Flp